MGADAEMIAGKVSRAGEGAIINEVRRYAGRDQPETANPECSQPGALVTDFLGFHLAPWHDDSDAGLAPLKQRRPSQPGQRFNAPPARRFRRLLDGNDHRTDNAVVIGVIPRPSPHGLLRKEH